MEGNTTITLHNESLNRVVEILREYSGRTGNPTPRTIANTIDAQRREVVGDLHPNRSNQTQDAIALMGLPGAGKSYVAEILGEVYDAPVISMGDAIRDHYDGEQDSVSLGRYAATVRRKYPAAIPGWTVELIEDTESELVIIDGVRSVTDVEVLEEAMDQFYLVNVTCQFYDRLDRLTERGREGEDEFGAVDLAERDTNELENLGVKDALEQCDWHRLRNNRGPQTLKQNLSAFVKNNLPFTVENAQALMTPMDDNESFLLGHNNGAVTDGGPVVPWWVD